MVSNVNQQFACSVTNEPGQVEVTGATGYHPSQRKKRNVPEKSLFNWKTINRSVFGRYAGRYAKHGGPMYPVNTTNIRLFGFILAVVRLHLLLLFLLFGFRSQNLKFSLPELGGLVYNLGIYVGYLICLLVVFRKIQKSSSDVNTLTETPKLKLQKFVFTSNQLPPVHNLAGSVADKTRLQPM